MQLYEHGNTVEVDDELIPAARSFTHFSRDAVGYYGDSSGRD